MTNAMAASLPVFDSAPYAASQSAALLAIQNVSLSSEPPSPARVTGWVQQPNSRGTWDIILTCLATIFVCTYTMLCLNIPSSKDTTTTIVRRRIMWMGIAIMAPEIVLTYAAGQWSRAHQSVAAFRKAGYKEWGSRQAFFADMGGFILDIPDFIPFPINAKQLHWLVTNGHLDYPDVDQKELWDKSKQDRVAKIVTSVQSLSLIHI